MYELFCHHSYFHQLYISTNSSLKDSFSFHFGSSSFLLSTRACGWTSSLAFSASRAAATCLEVLVVMLSVFWASSWRRVPVDGGGFPSLSLKAGTAFPIPEDQFLRSWAFSFLSVSSIVGCLAANWTKVPVDGAGFPSLSWKAGTAFPIPDDQFLRSWAFSLLSVSSIVGYLDASLVLILALVWTRLPQSWNLHLTKWKKFPTNSALCYSSTPSKSSLSILACRNSFISVYRYVLRRVFSLSPTWCMLEFMLMASISACI